MIFNPFKKYFVPHKGNNHQPYLLRRRPVLIILVFLLLVEAAFLAQILILWPYTNIFSSILPLVLVDLTNSDRIQNSIELLKVNPLLVAAAQLKANDMAQNGYFAHTSPAGVTPWFWLEKVGYHYSGAGENLAVNYSDSSDIENAWMNSPDHRANILDNRFSEIGIATAKGIYKGREAIFVVQFFGRPEAKVAQTAPIKTPAPKPLPVVQPKEQAASPVAEKPPQEMAVIKETEKEPVVSGVATENLSVQEPGSLAQSLIFKRIFLMPRKVSNFIYFFIAAFILLALVFKIFIKIKIQYPRLVLNGVLVLFVIISILYLNSLILENGVIF